MPPSGIESFLDRDAEQEIVQAILQAEARTSGEIRVHIERACGGDPFARARQLFHILKMDNTREGNGVLFYVAVMDRKFAIFGDRGINKTVPPGFWDDTKALLETHFRKGNFKEGLLAGIRKAGLELQAHFPWTPDDTNELDNEISKG